MRQKYRICQLRKKDTLNIKEFAVVEKRYQKCGLGDAT